MSVILKQPRRRSPLAIKVDIIRKACEPISYTHLMYQTNLSWAPMLKYLDELIESQYLETLKPLTIHGKQDKRTKQMIRTTEKGNMMLIKLNECKDLLKDVM